MSYQHECNYNNAYSNSEDLDFDTGCTNPSAKDGGTANVDDFNHQATVLEGTDMIHHSISTSFDNAVIPYDLNCSLPLSYQLQLDLLSTLSKHKIDLNLHEKSFMLSNSIHQIRCYTFSLDTLKKRNLFLKKIVRNLSTTILKPKDILVNLKGGGQANVAVFNLEAMILSLVLDENLMHPNNIAEEYDIFTGKGSQPDDVYGEIHTGDAWEPARQHFCGDDPSNMPLALVIFGDKSHLDLHGTLSTLPLTFTLSCFKATNSQETNPRSGDPYHSFLMLVMVQHCPKIHQSHLIVFKMSMTA